MEPRLHLLSSPVWTRGQKPSFKCSWSWSDASQITTSSSVIFPFTAALSLFPQLFAWCVGSVAEAFLSSLTLRNQMWHTEGSVDSREDKVTQSPTFSEGYARLPLTSLKHTDLHTHTLRVLMHPQSLTHTHTHRIHTPGGAGVFCRQGLFPCLCNLRSNYLLEFHLSHLRMFRKRLLLLRR